MPTSQALTATDRRLYNAILEATGALRPASRSRVLRALEDQDIPRALAEFRFDEAQAFLQATLPPAIRGVYEVAATSSVTQLLRDYGNKRFVPMTGPASAGGVAPMVLSFNVYNPRAVEWVSRRVGALIKEWGSTSRAVIQDIIRRGFEEGRTVQQMARELFSSGIGLTSYQERAVDNLRAALLRDVEAGKRTLTEAQIDARASRYADKLLRVRSRNIARTETLAASNAGQLEAWQQALDTGVLRPDQEREWLTAWDERTCDQCAPLNGDRARIGQPFPKSGVMAPPIHPQCRCTTILVRPGS